MNLGPTGWDLAWLPGLFLPAAIRSALLARTYRALRPGGTLLFACSRAPGEPLAAALADFRTLVFGGSPSVPDLAEHGFVDIRTLPAPPAATVALLVARKPKEARHGSP